MTCAGGYGEGDSEREWSVDETVTVFAPATVANLGPGFDVLGVAVDGLGDWVTVSLMAEPGIVIDSIEGDDGRLPADPERNSAGIAAREVLRLVGSEEQGLRLSIRKGLPLGSGLGSSGASASAAAWAVNLLFNQRLSKTELLQAALVAEAGVSGWHADNVGPSLFGGFVLIRSYDPLELIELPAPPGLLFVLVTPHFELPTRESRSVLPGQVTLAQHVANSGNLAAFVAALFGGSLTLLGKAMHDSIIEPVRGLLIPGFAHVKAAALETGALACSISGAGPTLYAITDDPTTAAQIARAMQDAFHEYGLLDSRVHIARVDQQGARAVLNGV
jgi:homoserine kinase